MNGNIPERDWREFKQVRVQLLEQFCQKTMDDLAKVASSNEGTAHDRYMRAYKLLTTRDKELAHAFDDYRRSTAVTQLMLMRRMKLLTDAELVRFTAQTQQIVRIADGR